MEGIISVVKFIAEHADEILVAINGLLASVIAICLFIPGEQPEKALQGIVDFLAKFSRKSNVKKVE